MKVQRIDRDPELDRLYRSAGFYLNDALRKPTQKRPDTGSAGKNRSANLLTVILMTVILLVGILRAGILISMKRAFFLILGLAISVGCFAASLRGTSPEQLKAGFAGANYATLPVLLILLAGFYWLKILRWQWLLAPTSTLSRRQLFPPMLLGFAANNILPAHLGEFIRVFVVRRQYGVPVSTVLSTVILERIFDVLAILALFFLGLMYSRDMPDNYRDLALAGAGIASLSVMAVVSYLVWTEKFVRLAAWGMSFFPFLPERLTAGLLNMLRQGADGLASLRSGMSVAVIVVTSLLQWMLNGLMAWVALRAFQIDVTLAAGLIVTGITAVAVMIPSTPGYFGIIQICFQISMTAQQMRPDPSLVLGASVYYHMSMYIPVTVIGLYLAQQMGFSFRDFQLAAETRSTNE